MTLIDSRAPNPKTRVLVYDPEEDQKEVLCRFLRAWDFQPVISPSAIHAIRRAARREFSIALIRHDGGETSFELLRALRQANSGLEAILIPRLFSTELATEAFRAGAYDCLGQPLDFRQLSHHLNALRESLHQRSQREAWNSVADEDTIWYGMVGASAVMRAMFSTIRLLGESCATVLVTGQTGTGKELAARALHKLGGGSSQPLLVYRCCGLSQAAAEKELFGNSRGASPSGGIFGQPQESALLLDEAGDLPLPVQERLDQVLQHVDHPGLARRGPTRLLVISRFNLFDGARKGRFSKGLYERFSKNIIHVPSLAERMEDLPLLSRYFLERANREFGREFRGFSPAAEHALLNYRWPGNVRELENVVNRACLLADGDRVEVQDLSIASVDEGRWPELPSRFINADRAFARLKAVSRRTSGTGQT